MNRDLRTKVKNVSKQNRVLWYQGNKYVLSPKETIIVVGEVNREGLSTAFDIEVFLAEENVKKNKKTK